MNLMITLSFLAVTLMEKKGNTSTLFFFFGGGGGGINFACLGATVSCKCLVKNKQTKKPLHFYVN